MNVDNQSPPDKQNPLDARELLLRKHAFVALCATRAHRYSLGEITLQEAVDYLQEWAERNGLIEASGQDTIQGVIARAFAGVNP